MYNSEDLLRQKFVLVDAAPFLLSVHITGIGFSNFVKIIAYFFLARIPDGVDVAQRHGILTQHAVSVRSIDRICQMHVAHALRIRTNTTSSA